MDVVEACRVIRHVNDAFIERRRPIESSSTAMSAILTLKSFLQNERGDGKRIHELELHALHAFTLEGIRLVMPFVLSAETITAIHAERRHTSSRPLV